jgi:2-amino-4-hydroxy-6-hydroxymethyldihydropteridine diphosphokinase
MNRVVVSFGSNVRPAENLDAAMDALRRDHRLIAESSRVATRPIGYAEQPDFINGAVLVDTELSRELFRAYLKAVEDRLGRVRGGSRFGPRCVDLDIVVWNGKVVDPDYYKRKFLRDAVGEVTSPRSPHDGRPGSEGA